MKLSDILKKLGVNLEQEIDEASSKALLSGEENKNNNVVEDKKMTVKYDAKTGLFDLKDIQDEELKAVLKLSNDTVKAKENSHKINSAVDEKISSLKLNTGITKDAVKKLLDMSNVKLDSEGAITGLDEAFDNLKTSQSGLFLADKGNKTSNPLLEGFNPQNAGQQGVIPNSFAEAFSMME